MELDLLHTVADLDNVDYVESNAPFICRDRNAWLGIGYYFWDTFIELAHWWGRSHYKGNGYMICKTSCYLSDDEILDLVGNMSQLQDFKEYVSILRQQYPRTDWKVGGVIEHMKKINAFNYKAIRVNGESSAKRDTSITNMRMTFSPQNNIAYLDMCPQIQVCVIDRRILNLPVQVIFPECYKQ